MKEKINGPVIQGRTNQLDVESDLNLSHSTDFAMCIALWNCRIPNDNSNFSRWPVVMNSYPSGCAKIGFRDYLKTLEKKDIQYLNGLVRKALDGMNRDFHTDYPVKILAGTFRWHRISGRIYHDPDGSPSEIFGVITDISDKKEIEEQLLSETRKLIERVKELNCLYTLSKIIESPNISVEDTLTQAVELIPPSWQYPEISAGRIRYEKMEFRTDNYRRTRWKQSAKINIDGNNRGFIEVTYLRKMPLIDEGPFLKEERLLINAMAEHLSRFLKRKHDEQILTKQLNQLSLGAKISHVLTSNTRLPGMLNKCCDAVYAHYKPARAVIWLLKKNDTERNLQAFQGRSDRLDPALGIIEIDSESMIWRVFESQKKIHFKGLLNSFNGREGRWFQNEGIDSCICLPLQVSNQPLGVFGLFTSEKIEKGDIDALSSVAQKIALGISRKWGEMTQIKLHDELKALTVHLQAVQESEKKSIARELHDELGQFLTAINLEIFNLKEICIPSVPETVRAQVDTSIDKISGLIKSTTKKTETMVMNLRPVILDDLGLMPALKWLIKQMDKFSKMSCTFNSNVLSLDFSQEQAIAVYRIVQESLTNISRHAQASHLTLTVQESVDMFRFEIADNGIGFKQRDFRKVNSFGILGMKERASLFGWDLSFQNSDRGGALVSLHIRKGDKNG